MGLIEPDAPTLFSVYRSIVGNNKRSKLNEFDVIRYEVVKETPRYYWVRRQDKQDEFEMQQKRSTSNSTLFLSPDEALEEVIAGIDRAQNDLLSSFSEISDTIFPEILESQRLYWVKFNGRWTKAYSEKGKNKFMIRCYRIFGKTGSAWRIDTGHTKTVILKRENKEVERYAGRSYIYPYTSKMYDPHNPSEQWIGTDRAEVFRQVTEYYLHRTAHLQQTKVFLEAKVGMWKIN